MLLLIIKSKLKIRILIAKILKRSSRKFYASIFEEDPDRWKRTQDEIDL